MKGPESRSSGKRLWAQHEVGGGEPAAFEAGSWGLCNAGSWGLCNAASKESEAVFLARREEKGSRRENEVSEIFIFSVAWILVLEAVDQH